MKKEKIPIRKCTPSNEAYPRKDMTRAVVNKGDEIFTDVTGKKQGRGAYVSRGAAVVEKAQQKKILEKYLKASKEQSDLAYKGTIRLIYRGEIPKRV